ncbi:ABC transporter substrate-binding protein [Clostridium sp. W14A]|nr:ABC transporter substrate-binding protein [Clostridium sp. W14A]
MMKKFLAFAMSLAMVFSLAACNSGGSSASNASEDSTSAAGSSEAGAPAGSSGGDLITVGFAQVGHESDWRTASTNSVQAAFSKDKGFDLQFVDCDNNSAKQLEAVRNFIQQGVDYIVIDPIVSTGWDTVLTEAQSAGIPVIVIDRTIDDSDKYVSWVGSEFTNEGLAAGAWLKAYAEKKDIKEINALVIEGTTGSSAQIGRTNGFKKYADANGWKILDSQSGNFTQDGGQSVMESYCKSYQGKFNVVVCQNDNEAFGAEDAMNAAGVKYGIDGDVVLISFDACKAGLKEVLSGKINADFQCNPLQGPFCADIISKLAAGQTVEKKTYMKEPWYVSEDVLTDISYTNNAGNDVTEPLIHVTQDVVDKAY